MKFFKRLGCAFFVLLLVLAASVGVAAVWVWQRLHEPYQGWSGEPITVLVEPGTHARAILDRLEDEGVLADARLARYYLVYALGDPPLKAGEYGFAGPATTPEILDKLIRGEVITHPVTLIEGLTLEETAAALAAAGFGDAATFEALMRSPEAVATIADLDPEARNLEGYLFPETYHFARGTTQEAIVRSLVDTFRRHYQERLAPLLSGDEVPTNVRELVTLASIIEKEARLDEERPLIAAVYTNRLRQGIALYADPTVIYALKLEGRWDGNLRRDDLRMDSPYNTYRNPGLPPGPIASPGLSSLVAAAEPADAPYLYFVSRNDGSHVFSETYAEHQRNVHRWQKLYWRQRWAEEKKR